VPPGPPLTEQEQPRLFAELRRIAGDVGQSMPVEVYLDPQVNAWVAQRGGAMGVGARRVMALGLPLLQALTVAELHAVLAHEFGHYHGGDTRLGPWVYKTRLAIVRTLQGLEGHPAGLQVMFLWYGRLFVRVTHAVSRAQELAADRLAARVAGSRALTDGLRAVHGASAAFSAYLSQELSPVLAAGFRPALAQGFARFLAASGVAQQVRRAIEAEIAAVPGGPYDTHPPLRERLAAVQHLAPGAVTVDDRSAVSLIDRLPELEMELLVAATGDATLRSHPTIAWDDVLEKVWIPSWQRARTDHAALLAGVTPASLPEVTGRLVELGRRIADKPATDDGASRLATSVVGCALAIALHEQGWKIEAPVGGRVRASASDRTIEPFTIVPRLANGDLRPEAWEKKCGTLGIATLALGAQ
jgi:heat shock protein HtpX